VARVKAKGKKPRQLYFADEEDAAAAVDCFARYVTKETYYVTKETYYVTKETYYVTKETYYVTKETCCCRLLRSVCMYVCETYSHGKRDLFTWQKRPIHMAKETYSHGKRDAAAAVAASLGVYVSEWVCTKLSVHSMYDDVTQYV
jgi:hypothetical protein